MKKVTTLIAAALFVVGSAFAVEAHEMSTLNPDQIVEQDPKKKDKEEVKVADLPYSVTSALNSDEYRGWIAEKAWKKKSDDGTTYYVKVKKGDETKKLKITEDGNVSPAS